MLNNYEYDVWGIIVSETADFDNPYKYAGYYYDTETGNYYLLSRYYNPVIARFISEDSYRGELNDPLSLNRYVYVVNNPLIYYDPTGYFFEEIWEGTKWLGKRTLGLVQGTGELAYDVVVGTASLAYDTGQVIGSSIGIVGNYGAYQLGLINETTFDTLHNEYAQTYNKSSQTLLNLPSNMVGGVVNNLQTTFNLDNFTNYLTTDNYNEIVDYSKSGVQTGVTLYAAGKVGYNLGKGIAKLENGIQLNNVTKNSVPKSLDDILKETVDTTNKAGIAKNLDKTGGFKQTLKDFGDLKPANIKNITTKYGNGKVGILPDGSKVIARPGSSGGSPTLEIQISNSKVYKIRYK